MRAKFLRAGHFKQEFSESNCVVPISVGQFYHEDDKFKATIDLINDSQFQNCTIVLCDSLQRHNLRAFNKEQEEAIENIMTKSLRAGDAWLNRNLKYIKQLNIPYQLERWNEWLSHPKYLDKLKQVKNEYKVNEQLRKNIDNTIISYLERIQSRLEEDQQYFNREKFIHSSLSYILEEMSVELLWLSRDFHFEVYPKSRPESMQAHYECFIKAHYPNKLRRLAIRFIYKNAV